MAKSRFIATILLLFGSSLREPPPLKWSELRYVFDIQEDCNGKEAVYKPEEIVAKLRQSTASASVLFISTLSKHVTSRIFLRAQIANLILSQGCPLGFWAMAFDALERATARRLAIRFAYAPQLYNLR